MPSFRKLTAAETAANPPTRSARAQIARAYDAYLADFAIGEYGRAELIAGEQRAGAAWRCASALARARR
jgi:hypothetical protein